MATRWLLLVVFVSQRGLIIFSVKLGRVGDYFRYESLLISSLIGPARQQPVNVMPITLHHWTTSHGTPFAMKTVLILSSFNVTRVT